MKADLSSKCVGRSVEKFGSPIRFIYTLRRILISESATTCMLITFSRREKVIREIHGMKFFNRRSQNILIGLEILDLNKSAFCCVCFFFNFSFINGFVFALQLIELN